MTDIKKAAEIVRKQSQKEVEKSAKKIYDRQIQDLIKADKEDFWAWWRTTKPPDLYLDPLTLDGAIAKKGGGSRTKGRKKPKKKSTEVQKMYLEI